ncbi:MAG: hypothetical protein MN733_09675 [Nitrososphaera sp.]|nr:hypothetical protein [Nitrososphaera sp.]
MSWNFGNQFIWTEGGADLTDSQGTDIPSGTPNHIKGSWVQLIASTAYPAKMAYIVLDGNGTAGPDFFVDIGVGAAASEVVVFPNLICGSAGNRQIKFMYLFPCDIPAGSRISARSQGNPGSGNPVSAQVMLAHSGMFPNLMGTYVKEYGIDTSLTLATSVAASGSINVKGAYAQITASTTHHMKGLVIAQQSEVVTAVNVNALIDIAIGAASSEQIIISNYGIQKQNSGEIYEVRSLIHPISVSIPAGSRIAARVQADQASHTFRIGIYGIH